MGFGVADMVGHYIGGRVVDRNPLVATIFFMLLLALSMLVAVPAASDHAWLVVVLIGWGLAYTALFPIWQVRVMQAGSKAQAFAAEMNTSAANAGAGLGAIFGVRYTPFWLSLSGYARRGHRRLCHYCRMADVIASLMLRALKASCSLICPLAV